MAVVRTLIGNVRGPQGEDGSSFEFKKTYASVAAMNNDFSGSDTQTGDYVLISAASINDADNGKMYRKGNSAWIYVAKITGPAGATGPAGPLCPLDTSMAVTVAGQAALDAALGPTLAGKLDATGDSANNTVTYTSDDVADGSASAWETVQPLTSEEKHESLFAKISKVVKNVRFLYKLLGTTDISGIGSGTVTDIMSALHSGKFDKANVVNNLTTTTAGYALDAREGKTLADNVSTLNDAYTTLNSAMRTGYSGIITSSVTGVKPGLSTIVRVGKQINFCLFFASTSFNSTSGNEITVGSVPADFRPLVDRYAMGYVAMNGTRIPTYFMIKTNGNVAFVGYANGTVQGLGVAGSYLYGD